MNLERTTLQKSLLGGPIPLAPSSPANDPDDGTTPPPLPPRSTLLRRAAYTGSLALSLVACADADTDGESAKMTPMSVVPESDPCQRGRLEQDSELNGPLAGPGVDASTNQLAPRAKSFVVASTYLRLQESPASQQRFGELAQPVGEALASQPGLLAIQFANSASCGVARTLSVWEDEESMFGFVASPAHTAAMAAITDVSRGGSITTHWLGVSAEDASWEKAAQELEVSTRQEY